MAENTRSASYPVASHSLLRAQVGWVLAGVVAATCLTLGLVNLVVAHADAIRLARSVYPPSTEHSGAALGMDDAFVLVVGCLNVLALVVAVAFLVRGMAGRATALLVIALFGVGLVCLDANLVGNSGWLGDCGSCGGKPQIAADEATRAFLFSGMSAVIVVLQLAWLRIRDEM